MSVLGAILYAVFYLLTVAVDIVICTALVWLCGHYLFGVW